LRNNDNEIDLLYNNPKELLALHQDTIGFIVMKFVHSGLFTYTNKEDVIQYVNEKLLSGKIARMQEQYNGKYYVVTYFSKIVYNLCLEYSRKERAGYVESTGLEHIESQISDEVPITERIIIEQECRRLKAILSMYNTSRPRTELYIKALFGSGITSDEVRAVFPTISEEDRTLLIERCSPSSDLDRITDKEVYALLTELSNKYDNKSNSDDAVRKWIQIKISEITELLNGIPKVSNYDKETLKILFEYYYEVTPF
jgi:RNA polymerase sigma factor (sigma-70 family)